MAVHKLSGAFFHDMQVEWPCPKCHQKTLQIIKESFVLNDTHDTQKYRSEDWFEPEMDSSVFSCMARCSRRQCGEVVACSGQSGWEQGWDEERNDMEYYQWHRPFTFFPSLHPFEIPEKCPKEITEPLEASFSIFLIQPGAAANLIRISVERMLTAMDVTERSDNGKRITLHHRLGMLPKLYESFSKPLMAIKFLGNAGSHTYDEVKIKDIEDAFEIMEYVVNDLFSGRKESIEVLTKRLSEKFKEN
ncbi:DUF4145 domain-containing protein [Salmonella enterica subsp. enterica serovar Muenster]|uniref:DUF4145 domain-containing protein n=3 Tax=root TaxID=1 RepID=A0A1S6L018_9CAUD|nr:DUF4145 domain-containing protein [Salmonella enterica]YP_009785191.1 DNA binding protein [Salmonella phage SEN8]EAA7319959.1 DUF4145 domain-containing protein [Salmonella enterica subsp. enterica]EBH3515443.1 DUF4145 domain-containing protein [Salmonella enterica subsp. enterica serovar Elisabethville]EBI0023264.1 DUF4145 domain-containing protein [Salmonella enterica subsp. enterica serovar London]EBL1805338.1 DUF4145 domain-containing protein [Salmonella enterica subsp. enterica serovar 